MLAKYFESSLRIQELRGGRDGHVLEGFAQELGQAGYAEITARRHIRAAEHLIHWIGRKDRTLATLDERVVDKFVHHLNRCRCPHYGHTPSGSAEGCASVSSLCPVRRYRRDPSRSRASCGRGPIGLIP